MVERFLRRPNRVNIRRPLPPPPNPNEQQSAHMIKRPMLAVTGTRPDKICAICLGKLEPGMAITYCDCGKFFHVDCIAELGNCPLCDFTISAKQEPADMNTENDLFTKNIPQENDIMEIVYQCPACDSYVAENADRCVCGAIFDIDENDIYQCPGCGHDVNPDAMKCENCGMEYE